MVKNIFTYKFCQQHRSAGFTLIELLVSIAMGGIVVSALLYFVVQLVRSDRQEFALAETQREMSMALNYIETDLKEAVYVYEGECLTTTGRPSSSEPSQVCRGLQNGTVGIFNNSNATPVLAFWKLDQVPENELTCSSGNADCDALKLSRNAYSLVVYSIRTDSNPTWTGPARLTRYELKQFSNYSTPTETTGFRNPRETGFNAWPCGVITNNNNSTLGTCTAQQAYSEGGTNNNAAVLVDLVDLNNQPAISDQDSTQNGDQPCPAGYSFSNGGLSANGGNNTSFYACIRRPTAGQTQDVIISLRGNGIERAGVSYYNNPNFRPTVQTQVQTRSAFNRIPPSIN